MNPTDSSTAREINRLHAEIVRQADASQRALHAALAAAWQAGRLLVAEKQRVRRAMGGGAWLLWLEENFEGQPRTAQKYMRLAQSVPDVSALGAMSLRQAYIHLGISTAPRSGKPSVRVDPLPDHVRFATKLIRALNTPLKPGASAPDPATYRRDLRALYDHLRRLFEPTANKSTLAGSNLR